MRKIMNAADRHLTRRYPRSAVFAPRENAPWKISNERNREAPENLEHDFYGIKRESFKEDFSSLVGQHPDTLNLRNRARSAS